MKVFVAHIREAQTNFTCTSIHTTDESAREEVHRFVERHWKEANLASFQDYKSREEAARLFFLNTDYAWDIWAKILKGFEEDEDIVELTPNELAVARVALRNANYNEVGASLRMDKATVINLISSTREKLED